MIFLEIFSLVKFLWDAELVEPDALVADFWDQDGLVASLEVSGSEIKNVLVLATKPDTLTWQHWSCRKDPL